MFQVKVSYAAPRAGPDGHAGAPPEPACPPGGRQTQPAAPRDRGGLFYCLHRLTGDRKYQDWGWEILRSFSTYRAGEPRRARALTLHLPGAAGRPCPAVRGPGSGRPSLTSLGTAVSRRTERVSAGPSVWPGQAMFAPSG